jgi:trigger factor
MVADVARRKALAVVLEQVSVKDASGNAVDLKALRGPEAEADAEVDAEAGADADIAADAGADADVDADADVEDDQTGPDSPQS